MKKEDFKKQSESFCIECGKRLKKNKAAKGHRYCYGCYKMKKAFEKGETASNTEVKTAVKKMKRNPGIFNLLFFPNKD